MQQIFNRKVIQKIMALFVILVLSNFIMSKRVYADGYAASSQDPSKESQATAKNGGSKQSTAKNSNESQANVGSKKDEKKDKKAKNNTNS